ncbi:cytidine deaminase [Actinomadura livida]|uniref:Cytidine deaminase n=1 Tax=Actinomadura livida TaxID=79909 RepID=A0ABN1F7S7_9ACTN
MTGTAASAACDTRTLGDVSELNPEDAKIITLARAARARSGAPEGAAVRDETGRTYAGTSVDLPSLKLSALQVAVAMAVSSGAGDLEAAAVVTAADAPAPSDLTTVRDLGAKAPVLVAGPDGSLKTTL